MQALVAAAAVAATTASSKYWCPPYHTAPSPTVRRPCELRPFLPMPSRLQSRFRLQKLRALLPVLLYVVFANENNERT